MDKEREIHLIESLKELDKMKTESVEKVISFTAESIRIYYMAYWNDRKFLEELHAIAQITKDLNFQEIGKVTQVSRVLATLKELLRYTEKHFSSSERPSIVLKELIKEFESTLM